MQSFGQDDYYYEVTSWQRVEIDGVVHRQEGVGGKTVCGQCVYRREGMG